MRTSFCLLMSPTFEYVFWDRITAVKSIPWHGSNLVVVPGTLMFWALNRGQAFHSIYYKGTLDKLGHTL